MGFFRKYPREIILSIVLVVAYFLVRLPNLTLLPIFTDEAIYLRWAQIALQDSNWRFISLTDGKQPLFIWFTVLAMKFINDPLLAGRLISVGSGFLTLVGLYILTVELFKKRSIAFITVVLYIAYPMAHVHDRLAIYDSLVTAFFVWAAYIGILLAKHVRLDIAYTLGFVIGAATLNKTSGFLSAYLLPVTLLFFDFKKPRVQERLVRWVLYAFVAFIISQIFYSILRLSPYFHIVEEKNATFFYPLTEWITHAEAFLRIPGGIFYGNLRGLTTWLVEYMTLPYILCVLFALAKYTKHVKEKLFLFLFFLAPFGAFALVGKVLFPRYIFFMSVMLLPLAAWSIDYVSEILSKKYPIKKTLASALVTVLVIVYPAYVSISFSLNPITAPIAKADSTQYVNNWTAGWGIEEAVEFFEKEAASQPIFIATQGTFGLMPYSLELSLVRNPNIQIKGYWPIDRAIPNEVLIQAQQKPAYFVFYQPCVNCGPEHEAPGDWPVTEVAKIRQGNADTYFILYKVHAPTQ